MSALEFQANVTGMGSLKELSSLLTELNKNTQDYAKRLNTIAGSLKETASAQTKSTKAVEMAKVGFSKLSKSFLIAKSGIKSFGKSVMEGTKPVQALSSIVQEWNTKTIDVVSVNQQAGLSFKGIALAIAGTTKEMSSSVIGQNEHQLSIQNKIQKMGELRTEEQALVKISRGLQLENRAAIALGKEDADQLEIRNILYKAAVKSQRAMRASILTLGNAVDKSTKDYMTQQAIMKKMLNPLTRLTKGYKNFRNIAKALKKTGLKKVFKSLASQTKGLGKSMLSTVKNGISLKNTLKAIKVSTKLAGKGYKMAAVSSLKMGKSLGSMGLKGVAKGMSLVGQKLIGMNEGFGRLAGGGIKMFSQAMSDIIRGVLQQGAKALSNFMKSSFGLFAGFEQSLAKIEVFGGFQGSEMDEVSATMQNAMRTTLFGTETLSAAFEELAAVGEFGGKVDEFNVMADVMTRMATATGEQDLERVGQILMTTSNAFRSQNKVVQDALMANEEFRQSVANSIPDWNSLTETQQRAKIETAAFASVVEHTGDVLTKVANESALSVSQIGTSMQYVNQTSAALGVSLEDTASMVGFLSNMGFEASRAGTALNQAMKSIIDPSGEARDVMAELGIQFYDQAGNVRPMIDIIDNLSGTLEGLTQQESLEAISTIFGVRGGRAILAMMNETTQLQDMMGVVGTEAFGAMQIGMDKMMNTIEGRTQEISGTIETLKLSFMDALQPALLGDDETPGILNVLLEIIQRPEIQNFFLLLADVVSTFVNSLLPLIDLIMPLLTGTFLPLLITMLEQLVGWFTMILEPLLQNQELMTFLVDVIMMIMDVINLLLPPIMSLVNMLITNLAPVLFTIIDLFVKFMVPIIIMFAEVIEELVPIVMPIIVKIMKVFEQLAPIIMMVVKVVLKLAMSLIAALMPLVDMLIDLILDNMKSFKSIIAVIIVFAEILMFLMPIITLLIKIIMGIADVIMWVVGVLIDINLKIIRFIAMIIGKMADMARAMGADKIAKGLEKTSRKIGSVVDEIENMNSGLAETPETVTVDVDLAPEVVDPDPADISALGLEETQTQEVAIDYTAGWEDDEALQDQTVNVDLETDGLTINDDSLMLNAEELDAVLSTNLEPLGSSILDLIDPSVLRDALGVGAVQTYVNAPTNNETPNEINNTNTTNTNTTHIENVNVRTREELDEDGDEDYTLDEFLHELTEGE